MNHSSFGPLLTTCALLFTCISNAAPGDEHWDYRFDLAGVPSLSISAMHADSTNLFLAGTENPTSQANIHRWNGTHWKIVGTAAGANTNSLVFVSDIAHYRGKLLVSGLFTKIDGVPLQNNGQWDGSTWTPFTTVTGLIYKFYIDGNDLYAGGNFSGIGGIAASNIARFDGSTWHALGTGLSGSTGNTPVTSITKSGSKLYVGGDFTNAGGVAATNVAVWDGGAWSALGNGLSGAAPFFGNPTVNTLLASGNTLYAGGRFTVAGSTPAKFIARWNGTSWSDVGGGLHTNVFSLCLGPLGELYAGGDFTNAAAGTVAASRIAKWNGSSWSSLGSGVNDGVRQMKLVGNDLVVVGNFDAAGGAIASRVAKWNGASWSAITHPSFSQGIGFFPRVLVTGTNGIYAGGLFFGAGMVPASRVARFDGTNWHALGSGVIGTNAGSGTDVHALALSGNTLYAGGRFTNAGGVTAANFARWNGTAWDNMGITFNNDVRAIATNGNNVYVGGIFNSTSWGSMNHIARWNGSSWSALGSGLNSNVLAIASVGTDIYVGGIFTNAGGALANRIARWNGSSWSPLGTGITNGSVLAIVPNGSDLYVAGSFTNAGGVVGANRIARWNGSAWSAVGGGANNTVSAIAWRGSELIASGSFTNIAGVAANRIARWNGTAWSAMGSGLTDVTPAANAVGLTVQGDSIFTSGTFTIAGGKNSKHIARWNDVRNFNPPAMQLLSPTRLVDGRLQFTLSGSGDHSYVIQGSIDLANWTSLLTNNVAEATIVDTQSAGFPNRYYRAVWAP